MADTYKARQTVQEALAGLEDEGATEAFRIVTDSLYEERDRANRAERIVEAYRLAISDVLSRKA